MKKILMAVFLATFILSVTAFGCAFNPCKSYWDSYTGEREAISEMQENGSSDPLLSSLEEYAAIHFKLALQGTIALVASGIVALCALGGIFITLRKKND